MYYIGNKELVVTSYLFVASFPCSHILILYRNYLQGFVFTLICIVQKLTGLIVQYLLSFWKEENRQCNGDFV